MKPSGTFSRLTILLLQAALVAALLVSGWLIYAKLPHRLNSDERASRNETTLQIVLRPAGLNAPSDIPIELYPVDIVAVRHEYFTERRAGKRFDDFLNERMQGRLPITARLDKDGQATIVVTAGSWWLNAVLPGDEDLEWRLPLNVAGSKQIVELTSQNVYTRTKSF